MLIYNGGACECPGWVQSVAARRLHLPLAEGFVEWSEGGEMLDEVSAGGGRFVVADDTQ
jgi:hypothetical protein